MSRATSIALGSDRYQQILAALDAVGVSRHQVRLASRLWREALRMNAGDATAARKSIVTVLGVIQAVESWPAPEQQR